MFIRDHRGTFINLDRVSRIDRVPEFDREGTVALRLCSSTEPEEGVTLVIRVTPQELVAFDARRLGR